MCMLIACTKMRWCNKSNSASCLSESDKRTIWTFPGQTFYLSHCPQTPLANPQANLSLSTGKPDMHVNSMHKDEMKGGIGNIPFSLTCAEQNPLALPLVGPLPPIFFFA